MSDQTKPPRSVEEMKKEIAAINKEIDELNKKEAREALATIKELIERFGFTEKQLFGTTKVKAAAKAIYRDPVSGKTWSGRGHRPKWYDASNPDQFKI